jgi:hypothetical protein
MTLTIDVYNQAWVKQATIFEVQYLSLKDSFSDIANSQLKLNRSTRHLDEIELGFMLFFNDSNKPSSRWAYTCQIVEEIIDDDEDDYVTFNLRPLKSILKQRIVRKRWDGTQNFQGSQSYIMCDILVYRNAVSDPDYPDRNFPNLSVLHIGEGAPTQTVYWSDDFSNLADAVSQIAMMSDVPLGWNVRPQMSNNAPDGTMIFNSIWSSDKTVGNTKGNKPVVFADYKNDFSAITTESSTKDLLTVAYGMGERLTEVTNGNRSIGFDRFESNIKSDFTSFASQKDELRAEIGRRGKVETAYTVELNQNSPMVRSYGTDWVLGDLVSLVIKGTSFQTYQVNEVEEQYEDGLYTLSVSFTKMGSKRRGYNTLLKDAMRERRGKTQYDKIPGKGTSSIWQGGIIYLTSGQSFSTDKTEKSISECKRGYIFVWSDYDPGVGPNDYDWTYTYVSKHVDQDKFHSYQVSNGTTTITKKFQIVETGKGENKVTQIIGHDDNILNGSNDVCLREVREWT